MTTEKTPTPFDPKTDPDAEYTIHALLPTGLTVASWMGGVRGDVMAGVVPITIPYGGELTVTRPLREANRDRNGVSWLEFSTEEQEREYRGRPRFGFGPTQPAIIAELRARRRAEIEEKRKNLLATSPAAARYASERSYLAALDAELLALDADGQNS